MAKWNSKAQLTTAELDDDDLVPISDDSEASGSKDKTASIATLRDVLSAGVILGVEATAHGFSVGDVLRHDGSDWVAALADTSAHAVFGGLVIDVPSVDTFRIASAGFVTGLTSLTAGSVYYLQDAGGLGTSAGTVSVPVLLATSATEGVIVR